MTGESPRPAIHFTAPANWINDPCGLVRTGDIWHLFYQHNPAENRWGPMHWGHAVSKDLITWRDRPIALVPRTDTGMAFTGSCVTATVDGRAPAVRDNEGIIACLFTGALPETSRGRTRQQQCLATGPLAPALREEKIHFSTPQVVLPNRDRADFRDPKVGRYADGGRWYMVLAAGDQVLFYSSPNLTDWSYKSAFGRGMGHSAGEWECPDLFELSVIDYASGRPTGERRWVLVVHEGRGLSTRHAGCEYITGAFDGGGFTALDTDFRAVDSGHDFYAAQTWWRGDLAAGPRPDAMWIAWVSHWAYSDHIQTVGWSGVLSLPRRVRLVRAAHLYGDEAPRLAQEPVESLRSARGPARTAAGGTIDVSDLEAFEIEIETDGSRPCRLSIECADAGRVQIEVTAERLTIDRSPCDMGDLNRRAELITRAPRPPHAAAAPLPGPARVIVDRSVIESFADGGLTVTTDLFLPTTPPQWVELHAGAGARHRVYPLQRTMRPHTR